MKPVKFKECNTTFAKNQPQYLPLPAHTDGTTVTSCWKLNLWECFVVFLTGKIYWQQLVFGQPLQPQKPSVRKPL